MNNNQFRKQEFEKRRVFKKGTSLCNAYSCPIFQNCLLEIKQLQQENVRLKDKIEKAFKIVDDKLTNLNLEFGVNNEFREEYDELWEILK